MNFTPRINKKSNVSIYMCNQKDSCGCVDRYLDCKCKPKDPCKFPSYSYHYSRYDYYEYPSYRDYYYERKSMELRNNLTLQDLLYKRALLPQESNFSYSYDKCKCYK